MARRVLRVADGRDGLQVRKIATKLFNNQSQTTDKRWPSRLRVRGGLTTPQRKKPAY
jgi:transposase